MLKIGTVAFFFFSFSIYAYAATREVLDHLLEANEDIQIGENRQVSEEEYRARKRKELEDASFKVLRGSWIEKTGFSFQPKEISGDSSSWSTPGTIKGRKAFFLHEEGVKAEILAVATLTTAKTLSEAKKACKALGSDWGLPRDKNIFESEIAVGLNSVSTDEDSAHLFGGTWAEIDFNDPTLRTDEDIVKQHKRNKDEWLALRFGPSQTQSVMPVSLALKEFRSQIAEAEGQAEDADPTYTEALKKLVADLEKGPNVVCVKRRKLQ